MTGLPKGGLGQTLTPPQDHPASGILGQKAVQAATGDAKNAWRRALHEHLGPLDGRPLAKDGQKSKKCA
jgi:hypothetical protein